MSKQSASNFSSLPRELKEEIIVASGSGDELEIPSKLL
jgi:hypothetical protein